LGNESDQNVENQELLNQDVAPGKGTGVFIKALTIFSLALVVMVLILHFLLFFFAKPLLQPELEVLVNKNEKKKYLVHFEELTINFMYASILGENVSIVPADRSQFPDSSSFGFVAAEIEIKGLNLWQLLFGKKLICNSFLITDPSFELHSTSDSTGKKADQRFSINQLHRWLLPALKEINIHELRIRNGRFTLFRHMEQQTGKISLLNFDLFFENLLLDSISHLRERKVLFSDSVFINFDKTTFGLQKENTEVSVDSIMLSAINSSVTLKNVIFGNRVSMPDEGFLRTKAEMLSLTGIDWNAIPDRKFKADTFLLYKAGIVLDNRKSGKKPATLTLQKASKIFYNALHPYFDVFSIRELEAQRLSLDMNFPAGSNIRDIDIYDAGIKIHNLSYDRLNVKERSKFLFADNFELSMKNQRVNLPVAGSSVLADSMLISGVTSRLYIKNLVWIPGQKQSRKDQVSSGPVMRFPELRMEAENLKNLILYNDYRFRSLALIRPEFEFPFPDSVKGDTASINTRLWDLADQLRSSFPGLVFKTITIDSAGVRLTGSGTTSEPGSGHFTATLHLDQVQIGDKKQMDSVPFKVLDYKVDLGNIELKTPGFTLAGSRVRYAQSDSVINAAGILFLLKPGIRDSLTGSARGHVEIGSLSLGKCSLDRIIRNKEMKSDKLTISKFRVEFEKLPQGEVAITAPLPFQLPLRVEIDTVVLEQGNLSVKGNGPGLLAGSFHNIGFSLFHLRYGNNRFPFRFTNPEIVFDSASFEISDHTRVNTGHVFISAPDSLLFVENPALSLNSSHPKYRNKISMSAFSLEKFAVEEFLKDKVIAAGTLVSRAPEISLITGSGSPDTIDLALKIKALKESVVKIFPLIQISELRIENGSVFLKAPGNPVRDFMISNGTYLTTRNLWIDELSDVNADEIFFSSSHRFLSRWFRIYLPDSIHYISIDQVNLNTEAKNLSTGKISCKWLPGMGDLLRKFNHYNVETNGVQIRGVDFGNLYARSEVWIDSILVQPPSINLFQAVTNNDTALRKFETNLTPFFDQFSSRLRVGHLSFNNGKLRYFIPQNNIEPYLSLYPVRTTISGISSGNGMENRLFNAEDISLGFRGLSIPLNDSLYTLSIARLQFSTSDSSVLMDSIILLPRYSREAFYEKVGIQTDYYDLNTKSIRLYGFNLKDYLEKGDVTTSFVKVDKLKGIVYRNKTFPIPPDKRTALPVTMLRNLNNTVAIDSVRIADSRLLYEEQLKDVEYPGSISFEEVNINLKNLTNDSAGWAENNHLKAELSAKLMGKGFFNAGIDFPYDSLNDFFRVKAVLKTMPLGDFNPLLNNLAFVYIRDGYNKMATLDFYADSSVARGKSDFRYSDLKIRLIDKKTLKTSAFDESAASFLANLFVVRTNNPRYGVLTRKGKIYFERDRQKSILNYLAKSALSGVVSTIRGSDEEKKEMRIKKREIKKLKEHGRD